MKRFFALVLVVVMVLSFAGCAKGEEEIKETVLKVAFNQSESHPQYKALAAFGEALATETEIGRASCRETV